MTREEAIAYFKRHLNLYCIEGISREAEETAIKALEQEPCEDSISRQAIIDATVKKNSIWNSITNSKGENLEEIISQLPPVTPHPNIGRCKECKYFEYDSLAKVNGIPLIVAHEICNKWGDGCQSKEDGYCFLFEPKESERVITNGDVINAIFPNAEIKRITSSFDKDKLLGYRTFLGGHSQDYTLDWWNAPYNTESEG